MIQLDKSKIKVFSEPGGFGNPPVETECIPVSDVRELIGEANKQIQELIVMLGETDKEKVPDNIPLTRSNMISVVSTFTRLSAKMCENYVDDLWSKRDTLNSIHFAQEDGVWVITSYKRLCDTDLLTFIKNFKSMTEFSTESRLPVARFKAYVEAMLADFQKSHPN